MMNKRQNERLDELSDALFGSPEELSLADTLETLKLAGIDPDELCDRTYKKLLIRARAYRARNEEVPARLRKALEDLRPATAPPRSEEELYRAASATISKIVEAVKGRFKLPSNIFAVSTSYRNKKAEESEKDQKIINKLEEELSNSLRKEEDDD